MDAILLVYIESICHVQLGLFVYKREDEVGAVYAFLEGAWR